MNIEGTMCVNNSLGSETSFGPAAAVPPPSRTPIGDAVGVVGFHFEVAEIHVWEPHDPNRPNVGPPHARVVQLCTRVRDRDDPSKVDRLHLREAYDPVVLSIADCVRELFHKALLHEADESMYVRGARSYDPHNMPGRAI